MWSLVFVMTAIKSFAQRYARKSNDILRLINN